MNERITKLKDFNNVHKLTHIHIYNKNRKV